MTRCLSRGGGSRIEEDDARDRLRCGSLCQLRLPGPYQCGVCGVVGSAGEEEVCLNDVSIQVGVALRPRFSHTEDPRGRTAVDE